MLYGPFVKDYKESLVCIYYNVIFLVRRLSIAISVNFLRSESYYQTCLCNVSCLLVRYSLVLSSSHNLQALQRKVYEHYVYND